MSTGRCITQLVRLTTRKSIPEMMLGIGQTVVRYEVDDISGVRKLYTI